MINIPGFVYICTVCIPIQSIFKPAYSNFNWHYDSF